MTHHPQILLLQEGVPQAPPIPTPPAIRNPEDAREAVNYQSRRGLTSLGIVEHIGVAPTYTSLRNYLKGANDPEVSATIVVGGDYVGQYCLIVGSGQNLGLDTEKLLRAANHAGAVTSPNTNPRPDLGNPNWWTVGKEHVGYPGQDWTPTMLENDRLVNAWLKSVVPGTFQYITGHYVFDPSNRANCPGPTFPWQELYSVTSPPRRALLQAGKSRTDVATVMQSIPMGKLHALPIGDHKAYNTLFTEYL